MKQLAIAESLTHQWVLQDGFAVASNNDDLGHIAKMRKKFVLPELRTHATGLTLAAEGPALESSWKNL